jgi:uncharacterized membrane protein
MPCWRETRQKPWLMSVWRVDDVTILLLGLLIFFGIHSIRIGAPAWRDQKIVQYGNRNWRGAYSILSVLGLILIILGFEKVQWMTPLLWVPSAWAPYATAILLLLAFILNAASGVPGNRIRGIVRHPMLTGVALWGFGHLLASGRLADLLLFGSFLLWAVIDFVSCLNRDRLAGAVPAAGTLRADIICVLAGLLIWAVFLLFLHRWLFGVSPLPL